MRQKALILDTDSLPWPPTFTFYTLREIERGWFEVTELRGLLENGAISEYQVTLKIGFHVLDCDHA